MTYIEISLSEIPDESLREWLGIQFIMHGFDNLAEEGNSMKIYIPEDKYNETDIRNWLYTGDRKDIPAFTVNTIKDQNWNKLWESNFEPVLLSGKCYVRAPFHKPIHGVPYEIIIEPKMSFGTAHHATTSLMIDTMLAMDFTGLSVLDMGCGTGILAILANKMGALAVTAIDNDEWAFRNAMENMTLNNISNIEVCLGDVELLAGKSFDVILANIQRNILIQDMEAYSESLKPMGRLLVSGFYFINLDAVKDSAKLHGLEFKSYNDRNDWIVACFVKSIG